MKNPVDEHFKQDLENIAIKPSANLWAEKIAPQLDGKKKKKPVIWFRAAAAIAILLSGWFVMDTMTPDDVTVLPLEVKHPIVIDEIEIKPATLIRNRLEPTGGEEVILKQSKSQLASSQKNTANTVDQGRKQDDQHVMIASTDPIAEDAVPQPKKKKIKVQLSLNTTSRSIASASEPKEERNAIQDYARTQWYKVREGEELEAPKENLINWPKIKVEGNPLRGVFAAKGE